MPLGTFVLTIGGEEQDGTAETKARLYLRSQGVDTLIDTDADEFKFATQFAKADGVGISLPYSIPLFTDSTSGPSTTIGYEGHVTTENGSRVEFQIAAQAAGTTKALTDLTDEVVVPISTTQQYRDEAEAARDEAVTAAASVPTEAELSATYAPAQGGKLRVFKAALAARNVDILTIGDSITEGTGPTLIEKRWQSRFRDDLRARYGIAAGGRGYVPTNYGVTPAQSDELWVLSGGAIDANGLTRGLGKRNTRLNAAGHKVTITVPVGHTDVDLLVTSSSAATSWYTPTVDGVAGSAVNVQALSSATERDVVINVASGLNPATTHTIEIAWAVGNVWVSGAMLYNGDRATGVRLWDGARHGQSASFFENNAEAWNYTINTIQPDLVCIALGRNDWSTGGTRTPTAYRASLDALVASIRAQTTVDPSIVVMAAYGTAAGGVPVAPWSDYVAQMKDLAADEGFGFLDLTARMGTITDAASNALGITSTDFVHPSNLGSQMIADALMDYVVAP